MCGFFGFVADATEKIAEIDHDFHPAGLGVAVLTWLRAALESPEGLLVLRRRVVALRVVNFDSTPTSADLQAPVSGGSTSADWYGLLSDIRDVPELILNAGFLEDGSDSPLHSFFTKWGYLVDLDTETFEVYRGSQLAPHTKGRFANREPFNVFYWPVALEVSWPLNALPDSETFLAATQSGSPGPG